MFDEQFAFHPRYLTMHDPSLPKVERPTPSLPTAPSLLSLSPSPSSVPKVSKTARSPQGVWMVVRTMREGERALATLRPQVAFGEEGSPEGSVPAHSEVEYELHLDKVLPSPPFPSLFLFSKFLSLPCLP